MAERTFLGFPLHSYKEKNKISFKKKNKGLVLQSINTTHFKNQSIVFLRGTGDVLIALNTFLGIIQYRLLLRREFLENALTSSEMAISLFLRM